MESVGHVPPTGGVDTRLGVNPIASGRIPEVQLTRAAVTPVQSPDRQTYSIAHSTASPQSTTTAVSLTYATAYARGAAKVLESNDPLRVFANGLASDMTGANGDMFASTGRLGALHNAFAFALSANGGLRGSSNLRPIA